jgi:hypothetical protein
VESDADPDPEDRRVVREREMTRGFSALDRIIRVAWPHTFVLLQKLLGYHPRLGQYLLPAVAAAGPAAGLNAETAWIASLDIAGAEEQRRWTTLERDLRRLVERVRRGGARPLLIYLPHPLQYDPDAGAPAQERLAEDRRRWLEGPSELQRRLAAVAADTRTPFLDLQGPLQAHAGSKAALHFAGDPHFVPEGQRVVGAAIVDWLRQGKWLD